MVTPWRKKIKKRLLVVDDHKGALSFTQGTFLEQTVRPG
jgi:hypothetical protein